MLKIKWMYKGSELDCDTVTYDWETNGTLDEGESVSNGDENFSIEDISVHRDHVYVRLVKL